tara:strand:+ start:243 stop:752 length:510 start_codon:yes stop_codon:yes gene_type:complete
LGKQNIKYEIIETVVGPLRLIEYKSCVVSISFSEDRLDSPENMTLERGSTQHGDRLRGYFAGDLLALDGWKFDLNGTDFQLKVWSALGVIPAGETRSYKWLANYIGRPTSVRAVANAVGRNPVPVVLPCHRVIATGGGLGGFTGRLWRKIALLEHEGAECVRQLSLVGL